jgi:hypothetical protein
LKAGTYTISSDGKLPIIQVFDANNTQLNVDDTITLPSGYYKMWDGLAIGPQSGTIHVTTITLLSDYILTFAVPDTLGTYIMLNLGSTALPYEPYGYKIPLTCAGQTVPVYLGQTQTVRRIKKLVLTGEENITPYIYLGRHGIAVNNILERNYYRAKGICTHYPVFNGDMAANALWIGVADRALYFIAILDTLGYTTADEFKSFLAAQYAAGTPVVIWYVLAEPETAIVNEPLAKIGDYADELHSTDAGVTIPTAKGSNTLSVDTTVQPSEMSITYRG